jgi:hypothetical protein
MTVNVAPTPRHALHCRAVNVQIGNANDDRQPQPTAAFAAFVRDRKLIRRLAKIRLP